MTKTQSQIISNGFFITVACDTYFDKDQVIIKKANGCEIKTTDTMLIHFDQNHSSESQTNSHFYRIVRTDCPFQLREKRSQPLNVILNEQM